MAAITIAGETFTEDQIARLGTSEIIRMFSQMQIEVNLLGGSTSTDEIAFPSVDDVVSMSFSGVLPWNVNDPIRMTASEDTDQTWDALVVSVVKGDDTSVVELEAQAISGSGTWDEWTASRFEKATSVSVATPVTTANGGTASTTKDGNRVANELARLTVMNDNTSSQLTLTADQVRNGLIFVDDSASDRRVIFPTGASSISGTTIRVVRAGSSSSMVGPIGGAPPAVGLAIWAVHPGQVRDFICVKEDDGVIVSYPWKALHERSSCVILDGLSSTVDMFPFSSGYVDYEATSDVMHASMVPTCTSNVTLNIALPDDLSILSPGCSISVSNHSPTYSITVSVAGYSGALASFTAQATLNHVIAPSGSMATFRLGYFGTGPCWTS